MTQLYYQNNTKLIKYTIPYRHIAFTYMPGTLLFINQITNLKLLINNLRYMPKCH